LNKLPTRYVAVPPGTTESSPACRRGAQRALRRKCRLSKETPLSALPKARAQLLPASLVFGLPGRNAAERAKKSPSDRRHSPSCIRMVYVDFMPENEKVRLRKERIFFELAERFRSSNDPAKMKQLGDQLGHFVFGESQIENLAD
jgi:hypothetical protein